MQRLLLTRLDEARDFARVTDFFPVTVKGVALEKVVPLAANSECDSVR